MRRLTVHQRDDHGVATLFLVLAMVAILVGAAFAIDVTRYALEARYARNSADATALAMAADCARTQEATGDYSVHQKPGQIVTNESVPAPCGNGEVKVKVTKPITDGILLQRSVGDVERSATAKWGGVGAADTIPLTLSECDFQRITAGGMPTGTRTVYFHSEPLNAAPPFNCNTSSSGQNLPGGFGWIGTGGCVAHVTLSTPSDSGNSPPNACKTEEQWRAMVGEDFLIPIYNKIIGNTYQIIGFAQFTFEGFKWNGNNNNGGTLAEKNCPHPVTPGVDLGASVTCLQGSFKKVFTQGPGGGFDFGAKVVWLDS
jgi:putative Flp pilus-assembly TadE/G-like protein